MNKNKKRCKIFLVVIFTIFISLTFVSAFNLEKHLIQLEQDENYPCHVENGNEIVCQSLKDFQIDEWRYKIDNLNCSEKNQGKLSDALNKTCLLNKIIPYESPKIQKAISISSEYREKIDIYSFKEGEIIIIFLLIGGLAKDNF